jgi:GTP-binding protein
MTTADSDKAEFARKLFAQPCDCLLAAAAPEQFPSSTKPEVAFIGRSNVGKSSLINGLTNRKNLARASNTPGRTQQIVFFELGKKLMLVDLPGYGHAQAPRQQKDDWNELVHSYLQSRPPLRCVFLLLDSRHGAMANDIDMMKFLDRAGVSYQIVMTKSDQVKALEREDKHKQVTAILAKHPAARSEILSTSAEKKTGMAELQQFICQFVLPN